MSTCTAEEIAEKKRIALERLNAKKRSYQSNAFEIPAASFYSSSSASASSSNSSASQLPISKTNDQRTLGQARNLANPYSKSSPLKTRNPLSQQQDEQKTMSTYKQILRVVTCRCGMVSENRFAIYPSEFNSKVIEVCKTIPSRGYDFSQKVWSFNVKDYDLVQERIGALMPSIVIGSIPQSIMNLCTSIPETNDELQSSYLASITDSLVDSLLPFQKEGVCFGIRKQGRILIADEMGLGKTYQALALADFYKEDWPLFIATTASMRDSWVTHIRKLLPYVACHYVVCVTASHEYFDEAKVVVCSYALMEKCLDKLEAMNFGVLIMDESHTLKSSKAKCTKVADKLAKKAKRIILLSGTPALSRPAELYTQLKMLDRKFLNFMEYTTRYCDGKPSSFGWDATGQSNLDELNVILSKKFMIRRVKADVLPQLAEKFRETVYLDPALVQTNATLNKLALNLSQNYGRMKEEILIQFYAETAHAKCVAVCSYLKKIVKEKAKFIVFAYHRVLIDSICTTLKELKAKHIRIDGSTKNELRTKYVDKFQKEKTCQVAVLSLKACNTGITLTAAQLIIFAELDWNPSTLAQAEGRAHRIGQEGDVICRYLLARNTADDIIWKMLKNKQDVLNKAGLFSDDLRDAQHITGPNSAGNIDKFVVKTPRKDDTTNQQEIHKNVTPKAATTNVASQGDGTAFSEDIQSLLDDTDDDFEGLEF